MGYHRVNITIPPELWADVQNYMREHDQTFSRLVQTLLSDHIRSSHHESHLIHIPPDGLSEERVREIVTDMIGAACTSADINHNPGGRKNVTRPPTPVTDPSFALSRYPDPVGLANQLDAWLLLYQISAREFHRRYGITLANKNRWLRGGGVTHVTADAIIAIISRPPDISE